MTNGPGCSPSASISSFKAPSSSPSASASTSSADFTDTDADADYQQPQPDLEHLIGADGSGDLGGTGRELKLGGDHGSRIGRERVRRVSWPE